MLDPRIVSLFTGLILIMIGIIAPSNIDTVQMLLGQLHDLNNQRILCNNTQCVENMDNSINYLNASLHVAEVPGNIKMSFFFIGILVDASSLIAFKF